MESHGWVPVDPADVRKVILEEAGGKKPDDPMVLAARKRLFGSWEMNWLAFNMANDVQLPRAQKGKLAFFMYPAGRDRRGPPRQPRSRQLQVHHRLEGDRRLNGLRAAAAVCALAAAAAAAETHLKPWSGGNTPALARSDLTGRLVDLKDLKGRVVLVNFWATWCEPCRDEMPSIERLRAKMAGRPFEVLTVNYGEGAARIASFLAREKIALTVLLDPDKETAAEWRAGGLPMTFLVDAEGRVRYSAFGECDWSAGEALRAVESLAGRGTRCPIASRCSTASSTARRPTRATSAPACSPRCWRSRRASSPSTSTTSSGCALYGAICRLPEYYPTRTEMEIFRESRGEIAAALGRGHQFVDLGAGDCCKGQAWLPFVAPRRYVAVDIALPELERSLARMAPDFPEIEMVGLVADFSAGLPLEEVLDATPRHLLLSRLQHRQLHARGVDRIPREGARVLRGAARKRPVDRRGWQEGRADPRCRVRRCARRDRGVQPQRAAAPEPPFRVRFRRSTGSGIAASTTRPRAAWRCTSSPCATSGSSSGTRAPFRSRRAHPHGEFLQVPAEGVRGACCTRPGSRPRAAGRAPTAATSSSSRPDRAASRGPWRRSAAWRRGSPPGSRRGIAPAATTAPRVHRSW